MSRDKFGYGLILVGCLIQFIVWDGLNLLSLISGLSGIIAVVGVSMKRFSSFIFCFLQLGTYLILCWQEKLWGEVGENIFYLLTMFWGLVVWNSKRSGDIVESRELKHRFLVAGITLGGIVLLSYILKQTSDPQPITDAISTAPAIVAQILMMLRYREQWIYWAVIDVASIIMWTKAGDYNMVVQFVFWTINCIYGWICWKPIKR